MEGYNFNEAKKYFEEKLSYTISCSGLKSKIDNGDNDFILIDVRDKKSFNEGRIPGAIFVDADNIENYWHLFSKNKLNIIYCYGMLCHRGYKVCLKAIEKGYPVADLLGNYYGWYDYPFDVEK